MLWRFRVNPRTNKRAGLALVLSLFAAAARADRASTAPQLTPTDRASMSVDPSPLDDLWISPHTVESGDSAIGTIRLAAPAPPGGAHIIVKPREPLYIAIDSNVVVPEGATTQTFIV